MSSLVIVESPAKAKTINKILGKGYTVKASVGHVMDLPAKKLGVNVDNDFKPEYGVIPGKEKVLKELKKSAKAADRIYLAPDPDREGEAIAYHVAESIADKKGDKDRIFRVTFNEITPRAVKEAMEHPGKIDMSKVDAQQARRVLDRLVGYRLSPLLWKKVRRGLSAGRVQSVAVRLIVERQKEREAFKQQEYWSINAKLKGPEPPEFEARLHKYGDKLVIERDGDGPRKFLITNEEEARRISDDISGAECSLASIEKKLKKKKPAPPFITSTLQQEASKKLGFAAKKTMRIAQQLYEGVELGDEGSYGLITYMRTDSVRVAKEAQEWARKFVGEYLGKQYVPKAPPVYKSKASAQEAHEAVRPTSLDKTPDTIKSFLSKDQKALYALIWNRFIASQMSPAELEQTTLDISCSSKTPALLRATGTVIKFQGFMAIYTETFEDMEEEAGLLLPALNKGDVLGLVGIEPKQHFTQPPPRYSEASLVKTLEERGIGRPSTYAAILSTIVDRKYVRNEDKRLEPTELGVLVNEYLVERFPDLLDSGFTAKMEDKLDKIETGKHKWVKVVKDFYMPFSRDLEVAEKIGDKVKPEDIATDEVCEKCGKPMVIRWGRHGRFLACSGYPGCRNTRPLEGEKQAAPEVATDEKCEKCGSNMVIKSGKFGQFLACSGYPECKNTKPIPTGVKCPEDGGDIVQKRTRGGKSFWSCSNYPKCTFAIWQRPINEKCPKCGAEFLIIRKERAGGTVKACHNKECDFKEALEGQD
jgi:DNA topoisomerase-1